MTDSLPTLTKCCGHYPILEFKRPLTVFGYDPYYQCVKCGLKTKGNYHQSEHALLKKEWHSLKHKLYKEDKKYNEQ